MTSSTCDASNIIYSLTFERTDGTSVINNFVTFTSNLSSILVYVTSSDFADVGIYTVTVTGRISNSGQSDPSTSTQFTLTVVDACATTTELIIISRPDGAVVNDAYTINAEKKS